MSLAMGKEYENYPKIKEKCYFTKLTSKRVIPTEKHLFGPNLRESRNFDQRNGRVWFFAKCMKTARK